jgi:phosphoribosyl 1,2-cyclic phosphate phosphodiesterase
MTYRLTFLGTGSSGGVPRVGNHWGACDRSNPKNRRRRCAVLVERFSKSGRTTVLVDTPCDIREQLLDHQIEQIDGVLYTHDHADHTHGIDDLRVFAQTSRRRVNVYMDEATWETLLVRFRYCFETKPGSGYPPILERHALEPGKPVVIDGAGGPITALPILQDHGVMPSLGFRFGGLAYSPDIVDVPAQSIPLLMGLDTWIVDALRPIPHPCHFSVKQALAWIERLGAPHAILTHLHVDLDYNALKRDLPPHVEPAYDGMTVTFKG